MNNAKNAYASRHRSRRITGGAAQEILGLNISPFLDFQSDRFRPSVSREYKTLKDWFNDEYGFEFFFTVNEETYLVRSSEWSGFELHSIGPAEIALKLNIYPEMFGQEPGRGFMSHLKNCLDRYLSESGFEVEIHERKPAIGVFECDWWANYLPMGEFLHMAIGEAVDSFDGSAPRSYEFC